MSEQKQKDTQQFDPKKPCKTRNGFDVHTIVLMNKIVGFIFSEEGNALMAEWGLDGRRTVVYDRKPDEKHELDLVNKDG